MKNDSQHIDNLIARGISGNATAAEMHELEAWKNEQGENEQQVQASRKVWEKTSGYLPREVIHTDKSKLLEAYTAYLSKNMQRIKRRNFLYRLAAILAFPVALAMGWYLSDAGALKDVTEQLTQVTSPKGHVSKCVLPDGTQVWINTGSTITYDINRFNKENREINLEGEAYFEVTSDETRPFNVHTPVAVVNVTGTSFNVMAYPEEANFETVLAEGSVILQFPGTESNVAIQPGERLVYNKNTAEINVDEVDANMFTSWRNGELLFKDATLKDLITELERIYDITFHLQPESLGEFRFRGMFSYNNNLIEALEKVKRTSGINYYIENKKVWLRDSQANVNTN